MHQPGGDEMDAYERLLGDAMDGDATLFARQDAVEAAWAIVRADPRRRDAASTSTSPAPGGRPRPTRSRRTSAAGTRRSLMPDPRPRSSMSGLLLAGDIGGTSTRLGLFEVVGWQAPRGGAGAVCEPGASRAGRDRAARSGRRHGQAIVGACFGVAGPVVGGGTWRRRTWSWDVDATVIARTLDQPQVGLINDLEANAHGIFTLEDKDLVVLNAGVAGRRGEYRGDLRGNRARGGRHVLGRGAAPSVRRRGRALRLTRRSPTSSWISCAISGASSAPT